MIEVFIDCEFDGFKGELISMGLFYSDDHYLYIVLKDTANSEWVQKNVLPILHHNKVNNIHEARYLVEQFFNSFRYNNIQIVADWWADIKHFCDFVEYEGGQCLNIPSMDFSVKRHLSSDKSRVPHNAIYDAEAIYLASKGRKSMNNTFVQSVVPDETTRT